MISKMNITRTCVKISSFLIIMVTLLCVTKWSSFKLSEYIPYSNFIIGYLMIALCCYLIYKSDIPNKRDYLPIKLFLIWWIFEIVRGYFFFSPGYYIKRQLIEGVILTSMPLLAILSVYPKYVQSILHYWMLWCLPLFFVLYAWVMVPDGYHFYLAPLFIVGGMLPWLPGKVKYVIAALLIIMVFTDIGARSQIIKSVLALLMSLALALHRLIPNKVIRIIHWGIYVLTFVLLYLGLTGSFNVFEDMSENKNLESVTSVNSEGDVTTLGDDTRTMLYYEVVASAVDNHYILLGRTPARGHDSQLWGETNAFGTRTGLYERFNDEMCMTNIFTQFGLIGIILYTLIYVFSSYLAVYKSKSYVMKLIGLLIAFHWLYGWVEDFNAMNISNISLWIIIGMGLSKRFRNMSDYEFKLWVRGIFSTQHNGTHGEIKNYKPSL